VLRAGGAGALTIAAGGATGCASDDFEVDNSRAIDAPNVLLIVTDSTRADYIGAYNSKSRAKTPNIDALAKEALRFKLAVPEAMPTGPARRTILTGKRGFPFRDWVPSPPLPPEPGWTPIGEHEPMLTELLGNAGIKTAYCTDNPFLVGPRYETFRRTVDFARPDYSQGAYRAFNRPFKRPAARVEIDRYMLPALTDSVEVQRIRDHVGWNSLYRRRERDYSAARVMRSGMQVLDHLKDSEPFFLGVDSFDPHEPFDPAPVYMRRFGSEPRGIQKQGITPIQPFDTPSNRLETVDIDDETLELIRDLYAAELTYADHWIGQLLNKMDDLKLLDDTLVMYLSDHGLTLGERGLLGKAAASTGADIFRVPFLIKDPEKRLAGQVSDFFASTHDVARTILSYMGVRVPGAMDGEDLSVLFEGGDPPPREVFTASYADNVIAGDGRWVLISNIVGKGRRLYDMDVDPFQEDNVADQNLDIVERLWKAVEDDAGGTLPMFGKQAVLGG